MAGFRFAGTLDGSPMTIETFYMKDTETLTVGDIINIESGEADLSATADTGLAGVLVGADDPDDETAAGAIAGTDSTTKVKVITNPNAIYRVTDANAREAGATLDVSGATGAQAVAASSNTEFVVVKKSTASEETLVMITPAAHYLYGT
jgi:hypothetical protein